MSKRRALIATNSHQRDHDWLVDIFQAAGWEVVVSFGEFAARQSLKRVMDGEKGFDVFVITDIWMQLFTVDEHLLPEALQLCGLNVRETGIRLCAYAKECKLSPEKILCIDVAEDDATVEQRVRELGACYTDYDHAEARLRRIMGM